MVYNINEINHKMPLVNNSTMHATMTSTGSSLKYNKHDLCGPGPGVNRVFQGKFTLKLYFPENALRSRVENDYSSLAAKF